MSAASSPDSGLTTPALFQDFVIENLGLRLAPVTMTTSLEQRDPVALTFNAGASVMPKHEASGGA